MKQLNETSEFIKPDDVESDSHEDENSEDQRSWWQEFDKIYRVLKGSPQSWMGCVTLPMQVRQPHKRAESVMLPTHVR